MLRTRWSFSSCSSLWNQARCLLISWLPDRKARGGGSRSTWRELNPNLTISLRFSPVCWWLRPLASRWPTPTRQQHNSRPSSPQIPVLLSLLSPLILSLAEGGPTGQIRKQRHELLRILYPGLIRQGKEGKTSHLNSRDVLVLSAQGQPPQIRPTLQARTKPRTCQLRKEMIYISFKDHKQYELEQSLNSIPSSSWPNDHPQSLAWWRWKACWVGWVSRSLGSCSWSQWPCIGRSHWYFYCPWHWLKSIAPRTSLLTS